ncbi:MAG: peptidylprolyl isomerase [Candidatus Melainabacteria bacterium]|nr:peptidylprolyl isomerase [Candidatus Melainabacteria bacterium]
MMTTSFLSFLLANLLAAVQKTVLEQKTMLEILHPSTRRHSSQPHFTRQSKGLATIGFVACIGISLLLPSAALAEGSATWWNPMSWLSVETANDAKKTTPPDKEATPPSSNKMSKPKNAVSATKGSIPEAYRGALLQTEKGNVVLELYPEEAPKTVSNFVNLVEKGFYNTPNMKFHRVVANFVVQTGDPTGTGYGGSKERIPLEVKNKLSHDRKGTVAMARGADPNSASSQFYITLTAQKHLDGKYAIFGRAISGLDVLDQIEPNTKLYGIKLIDIRSVRIDQAANAPKTWKDSVKGFFITPSPEEQANRKLMDQVPSASLD